MELRRKSIIIIYELYSRRWWQRESNCILTYNWEALYYMWLWRLLFSWESCCLLVAAQQLLHHFYIVVFLLLLLFSYCLPPHFSWAHTAVLLTQWSLHLLPLTTMPSMSWSLSELFCASASAMMKLMKSLRHWDLVISSYLTMLMEPPHGSSRQCQSPSQWKIANQGRVLGIEKC